MPSTRAFESRGRSVNPCARARAVDVSSSVWRWWGRSASERRRSRTQPELNGTRTCPRRAFSTRCRKLPTGTGPKNFMWGLVKKLGGSRQGPTRPIASAESLATAPRARCVGSWVHPPSRQCGRSSLTRASHRAHSLAWVAPHSLRAL